MHDVIVAPTTDTGMQVLVGGYGGDGNPVAPLDFSSRTLVPPDNAQAGFYAISRVVDDGNPDRASGTSASQWYTWNGSTYVITQT